MSVETRIRDVTDNISRLIDYANDTTEAGDTTIGDAVRTLVSGYGGGATILDTDVTLTASMSNADFLRAYVGDYLWYYYYPLDPTNTQLNTISVGYKAIPNLPITPTGVTLRSPVQYYINDQTYNVIRVRGNVHNIPSGRYRVVALIN